ncbi:MAG: ATP-dependent DNA helicase [Polaromonas sp.]
MHLPQTISKPDSLLKYCVSVRALCNFTAKHGDLDLRFTPAPSAQEGMVGHALVASRRDAQYQPEVTLEGDYKTLSVRGRADGYDPANNQLEEVKTYRGDLHNMADNKRDLHWAQVKIYGWLLCQSRGLKDINLALVYFDIASTQETPLIELFTAAALKEYFENQCDLFLAWAERELAHRTARDAALNALAFPHATFRPGQRELAEAVYKTASNGKCLMAQATTGIGKTIGTVFPLLKAMPKQRLDKLFFLAAKTPGRKLALDALELIENSTQNLPLRVLELVARDKSCEHPDKACHGDSCPLAKGFYDRLPQARYAAVQSASQGALDKTAMHDVALAHRVCPYYLAQEMAVWSDVVVGDYNYYFDTSAMLHTLTVNHQWRVSVLVDEAHNMIERVRSMYSAMLDQRQLQAVHSSAPKAVRPVLDKLNRAFSDVHKTQTETYQVVQEIPVDFLKDLQQAITVITDFLVANPTRVDADLQAFYFEALHFARMADSFASHSMFDITLQDVVHDNALLIPGSIGCATLNIRNIVPAPFLNPRFTAAYSVALFSATLSPPAFYKETLGLPLTTAWIDVASPFSHEQLYVAAVRNVSTRYSDRDQSLALIANLMAQQYHKTPGNYLAFTSSYDYLQKLASHFNQHHPQITTWAQTRQMDEAGREQFLRRFTTQSQGIGFAVLGGAFAEGIDLPGARLIGAFIATLGLPQVNAVNEEIKTRMAAYFEAQDDAASKAYNYTYLYPGLQKVVQAAGRVIRTQDDTGVIYLMDDRFTRLEVQSLLPVWWRVDVISQFLPENASKLPFSSIK